MTKKQSTQTTIELRPATMDDVELLTALSYKTIRAKYAEVIGKDAVEGYIASGAVPKYYRDRNAHCTVAVRDGEVSGVVATKDDMVDLMMVTLDHHRSGIGAILLANAEDALFETHDQLSLDCFRDNDQAVAFYKKHGWTIERNFDDPEHGIAMLRFVKVKTTS